MLPMLTFLSQHLEKLNKNLQVYMSTFKNHSQNILLHPATKLVITELTVCHQKPIGKLHIKKIGLLLVVKANIND